MIPLEEIQKDKVALLEIISASDKITASQLFAEKYINECEASLRRLEQAERVIGVARAIEAYDQASIIVLKGELQRYYECSLNKPFSPVGEQLQKTEL